MKEFKYGIETFTKEQFLWIREEARKQLRKLNLEIITLKSNRKQTVAVEFIKNNPTYKKSWLEPHNSISYAVFWKKKDLRGLHILLGLLRGTKYENMEPNARNPYSERDLKTLVSEWMTLYEKRIKKAEVIENA